MKYNAEAGLNPQLQEAIQEKLDCLNLYAHSRETKLLCQANLNGISTALHALTGELWKCERGPEGFIFINELRTECISTEL